MACWEQRARAKYKKKKEIESENCLLMEDKSLKELRIIVMGDRDCHGVLGNLEYYNDHKDAITWYQFIKHYILRLEATVKNLEQRLEMRRTSVKDVLDRNGLPSEATQEGNDYIDLITGKVK